MRDYYIDSINVLTGKVEGENGYLISPYSSIKIAGFRVSDTKVNAFKFSKKSKSYAARSEATDFSTKHAGVIGVNVFSEHIFPTVFTWLPPICPEPEYKPMSKLYWGDYYISNCNNSTTYNDTSSMSRISNSLGDRKCSFVNYSSPVATKSFDLGTEFSKKRNSFTN